MIALQDTRIGQEFLNAVIRFCKRTHEQIAEIVPAEQVHETIEVGVNEKHLKYISSVFYDDYATVVFEK